MDSELDNEGSIKRRKLNGLEILMSLKNSYCGHICISRLEEQEVVPRAGYLILKVKQLWVMIRSKVRTWKYMD